MPNLIATAASDSQHPVMLRVTIPERLNDKERRRKYDDPLNSIIHKAGIGALVRGFSPGADDPPFTRLEIELSPDVILNAGSVVEGLVALGAPAETMIELETEKATVSLSLAEAMGE